MSVRDWKGTAKMTVKKLGEIIGTTGDTGGTATAGTLIAKVNAILNTVMNGVKISGEVTIKETAQTKKFTNNVFGKVSTTAITITGSGKLSIIKIGGNQDYLKIILDGKTVTEATDAYITNNLAGEITFYFEQSVKFNSKNGDSTFRYFVQT